MMNGTTEVFEPAQKQFEGEDEFGLFLDVRDGLLASAAISLNKKDVQFTLSAGELIQFLRVINGNESENSLCKLMPPEGVTLPSYLNLRILNIGRFMIHFSDAELARFRSFLQLKLTTPLAVEKSSAAYRHRLDRGDTNA